MALTAKYPVFDGHNDALLRLWSKGADSSEAHFRADPSGHLDIHRAKAGGFVGGFFALFAPPGATFRMPKFIPPYDQPMPPKLPQDQALVMVSAQAGILHRLAAHSLVAICKNRAEIDAAIASDRIAAIMHLEGAEAIDPDLAVLDLLYAAGLRSIGPVWSRPNIFGHGAPFRYPSDSDTGPGLTDAGKRLVRRCVELGVIVDTSHLTMAGFHDIANAGLPLVATHSNAHAISPCARNLTDDQLRAIGQTGGMVGLNFGTMFLRPDGRVAPEGALDAAMRHLDRMLELAGEACVGLGSDFDGAPMPAGLGDASELPNLIEIMESHGLGTDVIRRIASANWLDFIARTLG